jgi:hypothetical protein
MSAGRSGGLSTEVNARSETLNAKAAIYAAAFYAQAAVEAILKGGD